MKKFFGVLFLLIGLFAIVTGVGTIASTDGYNRSFEGQVQEELIDQYRANRERDQGIGGAFAFVGGVFFIVGIVLLVTKTKKQRMMETELALLKGGIHNKTEVKPTSQDDTINQLERLSVLKEKGVLSEEEFMAQKIRVL
ncbi:hypothetical protein [Flavobacterium sp. UBA7682]|uniref:hypothetical protein n=1 Tax=Flavobacterium sp. UBA7682 TaxID=1946560 RepID=UPI0025BC300F|nr:hypothetical protein [Flavobacterium sp. UBA7682]